MDLEVFIANFGQIISVPHAGDFTNKTLKSKKKIQGKIMPKVQGPLLQILIKTKCKLMRNFFLSLRLMNLQLGFRNFLNFGSKDLLVRSIIK